MSKNFYYSFNIGFEDNSINIGVDDVSFSILYTDTNEYTPEIKPIPDGYNIYLRNIYEGIDIKFILKESDIKEFIYIKNRKSKKKIKASIKIDNGSISYDDKNTQYDICDSDGNIAFSLPKLFVIDKKGLEDKTLKDFIKLNYDFKNKEFIYEFNHKNVKRYPVVVDPSFVFNTTIKNRDGITYGGLDKENIMLVSGGKTQDLLMNNISSLESDNHGNVSVVSDDVIFENNMSLFFPAIMSGLANVYLQRDGEEREIKSIEVEYIGGKSINSNPVVYSLFNFDFSFDSPGAMDIVCNFPAPKFSGAVVPGTDPLGGGGSGTDAYFYAPPRGHSVSYKRKVTYLPKVHISFPDNIDCVGISDGLVIENVSIKNNSSFKPLKYSIIPYKFDSVLGSGEYLNISNSDDFFVRSKEVTRTSYRYLNSIFDISSSYIPVPSKVNYNASSFLGVSGGLAPIYSIKKGDLESFQNKIIAVLHSAVNSRNNIQQDVEFSKTYFAISKNDYSLSKINSSSRALKNVSLRLSSRSFMSFILNNGVTFKDYFNYCEGIEVSSGFNIKESIDGNTIIEFESKEIFSQSLGGDFKVSDVGSVGYGDIDENVLKKCSLCLSVQGRVYTYEILESNPLSLKIEGKRKETILSSNSFSVLLFDPVEIYFKNMSSDKKMKLEKETINNDGSVSYKTVSYDSNLPSGDDTVSLYEKRKNFTLNKDINIYRLEVINS